MKGRDQYPAGQLFGVRSTWMHFIGAYYEDTDRFVREAGKHGISRRVPAQVVRGMNFGDRIIFLRYIKNASYAFAEGVITGITLDSEIADELGKQLQDRGLAHFEAPAGGGATEIQRACGSYFLMGGWVVNVSLSDCIEIALEVAASQGKGKIFCMVNARLTNAYQAPVYLQPAPKFTRGFVRATAEQEIIMPDDAEQIESKVFSIRNYSKNARPPRLPARTGRRA